MFNFRSQYRLSSAEVNTPDPLEACDFGGLALFEKGLVFFAHRDSWQEISPHTGTQTFFFLRHRMQSHLGTRSLDIVERFRKN